MQSISLRLFRERNGDFPLRDSYEIIARRDGHYFGYASFCILGIHYFGHLDLFRRNLSK